MKAKENTKMNDLATLAGLLVMLKNAEVSQVIIDKIETLMLDKLEKVK
jgi:hypothetical protein